MSAELFRNRFNELRAMCDFPSTCGCVVIYERHVRASSEVAVAMHESFGLLAEAAFVQFFNEPHAWRAAVFVRAYESPEPSKAWTMLNFKSADRSLQ